MKQKGFTIVELLVAAAVFSLVIGGAFNLLISSIGAQQQHLASDRLFNQSSYLTEYMTRALRQAKKELSSSADCLTTAGRGFNYEINAGADRIRFLDKNNLCREFLLSGAQVQERISSDQSALNFGPAIALTPAEFQVQTLKFSLLGEGQADFLQPRATVFMRINNLEFQTTVSQRNFDVQQ